jgi:hypothetical protein
MSERDHNGPGIAVTESRISVVSILIGIVAFVVLLYIAYLTS